MTYLSIKKKKKGSAQKVSLKHLARKESCCSHSTDKVSKQRRSYYIMILTVLAASKLQLNSSMPVVFLCLEMRSQETIIQEVFVQILEKESLIYLRFDYRL